MHIVEIYLYIIVGHTCELYF
ncbi:hypothetical protein Zm00014a_027252 [Zea mays]|uniref:Uncharacterized protein n=1 Tax=Zea mays TaxID=4577 RepID=A0A317Y4R4_MAIZE|nr:hypothetical protein Zm00014a_027252 [Zea mays]